MDNDDWEKPSMLSRAVQKIIDWLRGRDDGSN